MVQIGHSQFIVAFEIELGYPHPGCAEFGEPDSMFAVYKIDVMDDSLTRMTLEDIQLIYKDLEGRADRIEVWRMMKTLKGMGQ